jgi:hypothetical protein
MFGSFSCRRGKCADLQAPPPKRLLNCLAVSVAGLLMFSTQDQARGQAKADMQEAAARWTILFRSDDPSIWDTDTKNSKGVQVSGKNWIQIGPLQP